MLFSIDDLWQGNFHSETVIYTQQFDNKILQNKLLCIYHSFTMEVLLPQIIKTIKHTKNASNIHYCSNRVIVQHVSRRILQF